MTVTPIFDKSHSLHRFQPWKYFRTVDPALEPRASSTASGIRAARLGSCKLFTSVEISSLWISKKHKQIKRWSRNTRAVGWHPVPYHPIRDRRATLKVGGLTGESKWGYWKHFFLELFIIFKTVGEGGGGGGGRLKPVLPLPVRGPCRYTLCHTQTDRQKKTPYCLNWTKSDGKNNQCKYVSKELNLRHLICKLLKMTPRLENIYKLH